MKLPKNIMDWYGEDGDFPEKKKKTTNTSVEWAATYLEVWIQKTVKNSLRFPERARRPQGGGQMFTGKDEALPLW